MDGIGELLGGALWLDPAAFSQIISLPHGALIALVIVLVAGIAEAIGQSIVLFVNRVRPFRFILSLLIAAVLFAFTFVFWTLSTWGIAYVLFRQEISLLTTIQVMGLSYAPQLFSFLEALPYIGTPIAVLLTIWSLLALIVGLEVTTALDSWSLLVCTGLGWVVLQLLRRTLGQPIEAVGQWISNVVAGTTLITDRTSLRKMVLESTLPASFTKGATELVEAAAAAKPSLDRIHHRIHRRIQLSRRWIIFTSLVLVVLGAIVLFNTVSWSWYGAFTGTLKLAIDLTNIALIAVFASILLTPLETLSWWAGWYGDEPIDPGTLVEPGTPDTHYARYVTYLDGINQGSYQYLPEVERFLDQLADRLPPNVAIVKGIMPYSPINRPLTAQRPLAFLWRLLDSIMLKNPTNPVALIVNIRNVVAVAVAADQRYGPIQNQGLARVLLNSLLHYGYQLGSKTPITLIGYSGGGQMSMGAATFLKRYTGAPVEVISIAGVISGNTGAMEAERIYHLVGQKDIVEKLGPVMFPGRWGLYLLSNWNQAKRRGKINFFSLGTVGHMGNSGPFGKKLLEDGRSHLQQTIDLVTGILLKDWALAGVHPDDVRQTSNYERYKQAPFNQPSYYPLDQAVDPNWYRPIAPWMGRLILPRLEERQQVQGVLFEVHHADADHEFLVGQTVWLRWGDSEAVKAYTQLVTQDVRFVEHVQVSQQQGNVHPDRINHWQKVTPLESIAAARPEDDVIVALSDPVTIKQPRQRGQGISPPAVLYIEREPIQITGRYCGLVQILAALGNDRFQVRHYDRTTQQFTGAEEVVLMPKVIADRNGVNPSTTHQIEQSPLNATGWYIYGAKNEAGVFVVQGIVPRKLFSLLPDAVITGENAALDYINYDYWKNVAEQKGQVKTVLLLPTATPDSADSSADATPSLFLSPPPSPPPPLFQENTCFLLMHTYGGIGGNKAEFAPMGIFFGHFAFGFARVVSEPLSEELRFELEYRQVYTHNTDGMIAGRNSWSRYLGDRQFGWLGSRPIADIIVDFPPLTQDYDFDGIKFSPLNEVVRELAVMAARYRVGDGTGTTFVSSVNSCVQDSSHALYSAIRRMMAQIELNPLIVKWLRDHPDHEQTKRFQLLGDLIQSIDNALTPLGMVRPDWKNYLPTLGRFPEETPLRTLVNTLASWRSLLPRLTNDLIAMIFLQLGATLWVIRANQIGGFDPEIEPIAPTDFSFQVPKVKKSDS